MKRVQSLKHSANATDEKLASRISSVTRMMDEEVQKLFPDSSDVEKLIELMKIVKSSQRRNTKIKNCYKRRRFRWHCTDAFAEVCLT